MTCSHTIKPTFDVVRHAVALERRVGDQLGARAFGPPEAPVVGDVAVVQRLLVGRSTPGPR